MRRARPLRMEAVISDQELDLQAWVREWCRAILGLNGIAVAPEPRSVPKESAV